MPKNPMEGKTANVKFKSILGKAKQTEQTDDTVWTIAKYTPPPLDHWFPTKFSLSREKGSKKALFQW